MTRAIGPSSYKSTETMRFEKIEDEVERLRSDNERLKEWCRKLIEGGTFPGEADNLRSLNAELVVALEEIATHRIDSELASKEKRSMALNALAKVKEGK